MASIVVRVRSKVKASRYTLSPNDTLLQLKEKIENDLEVPIQLQQLSKHPSGSSPITGDNSTLSQLGIVHGDMLHVLNDVDASNVGISLASVRKDEFQAKQIEQKRDELREEDAKYENKEEKKNSDEKTNDEKTDDTDEQEEISSGRKHITYHEFSQGKQFAPEEPRYTIKENCKKHRPWPQGLCNDCKPEACILMRQKYRHVDFVEFVNFDEFSKFAAFWERQGGSVQRMGLLYGRYESYPHYPGGVKAVVEAIYEPPQECALDVVRPLQDPNEDKVEQIAEALGIERVGWIFTHPSREFPPSSYDIRLMAKFQNAHRFSDSIGSPFVTLALTRNSDGHIEPRAFMASDQCMALEKAGLLDDPQNLQEMKIREPIGREYLPQVIKNIKGSGPQDVKTFEPEFFIVEAGCGTPANPTSPLFKHSIFPTENRSQFGERQTLASLKRHILQLSDEHFDDRIKDFHLLLYLHSAFDLATTIAVCQCISRGEPIPEGISLMIEALPDH